MSERKTKNTLMVDVKDLKVVHGSGDELVKQQLLLFCYHLPLQCRLSLHRSWSKIPSPPRPSPRRDRVTKPWESETRPRAFKRPTSSTTRLAGEESMHLGNAAGVDVVERVRACMFAFWKKDKTKKKKMTPHYQEASWEMADVSEVKRFHCENSEGGWSLWHGANWYGRSIGLQSLGKLVLCWEARASLTSRLRHTKGWCAAAANRNQIWALIFHVTGSIFSALWPWLPSSHPFWTWVLIVKWLQAEILFFNCYFLFVYILFFCWCFYSVLLSNSASSLL